MLAATDRRYQGDIKALLANLSQEPAAAHGIAAGAPAHRVGQARRAARERLPAARPGDDRRRAQAGAAPLCAGGREGAADHPADPLPAAAGCAARGRVRRRLRPHPAAAGQGIGHPVRRHPAR
ncbi:hypothetical protein G6F66_014314 [Rhizopus arrhizus]|nr:hypothetical protein G6F66_014314 [Rhizopus arrhizus]